jgi:hypothetical protein
MVENCVRRYRELFDPVWKAAGIDHDASTSPAAEFVNMPGRRLFEQHLIQMVVQIALELALQRSGSAQPEDHVAALNDVLASRKMLPILPQPGQSVRSHLETLMGKKPRAIVGMYDDQLFLEDALARGDPARLLQLRPLLAAVVRLEYFVQSWPPAFDTLFFAHPTRDHMRRMEAYVDALLLSPEGKAALGDRLVVLRAGLEPTHNRLPILVAPDHRDDPVAWNIRELLSLRSFLAALPGFLRGLLDGTPFGTQSALQAIEGLAASSDDATSAYVELVADKTDRLELKTITNSYRLAPGRDERARDVYFLFPT